MLKKQAVLDERNRHLPTNTKSKIHEFEPNKVAIVDKSYIDQLFEPASKVNKQLMVNSIKKYLLNTEQERAFHIIANHATMEQPDKLRMYLGGMGGTGKSQVIKALIYIFW